MNTPRFAPALFALVLLSACGSAASLVVRPTKPAPAEIVPTPQLQQYAYKHLLVLPPDGGVTVDDAIAMVRGQVESGDTPPGLEGAKMLMLVNRETGKGVGITLFESEEAMRRGDEALNAMNPGGTERRTSVEFYEVPVQTVS